MTRIHAWFDISASSVPTLTNETGFYGQMNTAFSTAVCEMTWDAEKKSVVEDSKWTACSDLNGSPSVIRTMSAAPVVTETCEPGYLMTLQIKTTHADAPAAATYAGALKARVSPFIAATYFETAAGTKTIKQSTDTTASTRPARPACAVPATNEGAPSSACLNASTWAPVAAALALAAMV